MDECKKNEETNPIEQRIYYSLICHSQLKLLTIKNRVVIKKFRLTTFLSMNSMQKYSKSILVLLKTHLTVKDIFKNEYNCFFLLFRMKVFVTKLTLAVETIDLKYSLFAICFALRSFIVVIKHPYLYEKYKLN